MTAEKKSNVTDGKTKKAAGKSGKGVGVNNNNNNTLNKKKSSAEVKVGSLLMNSYVPKI